MQEVVWLAHGGPGSGRYPKGSGKKYLKKQVRTLNKTEKERARTYLKYKYSRSSRERESLNIKEKELMAKANKIKNNILFKNKNVKLKDVMKIDFSSMMKYSNEPFGGAYSGYKLQYKKK